MSALDEAWRKLGAERWDGESVEIPCGDLNCWSKPQDDGRRIHAYPDTGLGGGWFVLTEGPGEWEPFRVADEVAALEAFTHLLSAPAAGFTCRGGRMSGEVDWGTLGMEPNPVGGFSLLTVSASLQAFPDGECWYVWLTVRPDLPDEHGGCDESEAHSFCRDLLVLAGEVKP